MLKYHQISSLGCRYIVYHHHLFAMVNSLLQLTFAVCLSPSIYYFPTRFSVNKVDKMPWLRHSQKLACTPQLASPMENSSLVLLTCQLQMTELKQSTHIVNLLTDAGSTRRTTQSVLEMYRIPNTLFVLQPMRIVRPNNVRIRPHYSVQHTSMGKKVKKR